VFSDLIGYLYFFDSLMPSLGGTRCFFLFFFFRGPLAEPSSPFQSCGNVRKNFWHPISSALMSPFFPPPRTLFCYCAALLFGRNFFPVAAPYTPPPPAGEHFPFFLFPFSPTKELPPSTEEPLRGSFSRPATISGASPKRILSTFNHKPHLMKTTPFPHLVKDFVS